VTSQADQIQDAHLLSFVIASADMRYVEVNERDVYLRQDPELGLIVRGEMTGCGPDCYVDLNQILLEYALSCEGCKDHVIAEETADHFGRRFAKALVAKLAADGSENEPLDSLATIFECILRSMSVPFEVDRQAGVLRYELDDSPLHQAAKGRALNLGLPMARRAFITLCDTVVETLTPEWELSQPIDRAADKPILVVELVPVS